MPKKRGVGSLACSSRLNPRLASCVCATLSRHACTKRGPTSYSAVTWASGRLLACLPIASRKRTVVRLRLPQALSLSVKAFWQRKHQKRRLCSTNSTRCPLKGTSRLQRWRTSCCLTQMAPQYGQLVRSLVPITSTRTVPSACTSCLRIRSSANSKGTTIPCSWLTSSLMVSWVDMACPPADSVWFSYQV